YALAAISHVVKNLGNEQTLGVLYDIVCKCQKRIEVTIFHAFAHSVDCQVKYFPRYVKGMALTGKQSCVSASHNTVINSFNL
ncbi:hypothetical protein MUCCIDRAFT_144143, partial [Mucor lusitanicus CBS 277.49]